MHTGWSLSTQQTGCSWGCNGRESFTYIPLSPLVRAQPLRFFSALADALLWILGTHGIKGIHYLDDFLLFGVPQCFECRQAPVKTLAIRVQLGVPVAAQKTEGPKCALVFLGIELDTSAGTLQLPQVKLP